MRAKHAAAVLATATAALATTSACSSSSSSSAAAGAPAGTASTAPATTAPTSAAPTSAAPSPATFTADYRNHVAAAWLTTDQLPFKSAVVWQGIGGIDTGQKHALQQDYYSCNTEAWKSFYGSADDAIQAENFAATGGFPQLSELQIFFTDAATAKHALDLTAADFAACPAAVDDSGAKLTDALKKSATIDSGFAYVHTARTSDGGPGSAMHWGSDAHEYVVQRGNLLVLVTVYGRDSIDDASGDSALLQKIADEVTSAYTAH